MNRSQLRQLAEERLADATVLLDQSRWSAAYYLAGYAIECGLKACIMRRVEEKGVIFEEKKFSEQCWTHEFEVLLRLADLSITFVGDRKSNFSLGGNWDKIQKWSESSRYQLTEEAAAKNLYDAISNRPNGVMEWIRQRW